MSKRRNKIFAGLALCAALLAAATFFSLRPVGRPLHSIAADAQTVRITDRNGLPLTVSYKNQWNSYDFIALYNVPEFLKNAFLLSEDNHFLDHHGVDWRARLGALWQNTRQGHTVRGASTVSEQVVRMINPRPRTLWSKWLEGFESARLEKSESKADILEFYLNQVPYTANRRGIVQAARYYFGRDLSTLSLKEMLALAVMARAPSDYDLYRHPGRIDAPLARLADRMAAAGLMDDIARQQVRQEKLAPAPPPASVNTEHFIRYVRLNAGAAPDKFRTTLDTQLQGKVQEIVYQRLKSLGPKNVQNAAAIVVDHKTGEVLAWVVGGADADDTPGGDIDAVLTPRQPGSAMKPFLYARALEKGWTAATILNDFPLAEAVGTGLHRFRNYSNSYYGPVTLREALGNSLNIPALRTIAFVTPGDYLSVLQKLGFTSLDKSSGIYDEGLALGDGEVSLFELVQGYAALAEGGVFRPLKILISSDTGKTSRVYSDETASIIGNILSDPFARQMEFGAASVLNLPVQTAVKTGTSTDYHDAWVVGYDDRYVVGLWMGNLDRAPMNGVTGSTGPALALRAIFSLLNQNRDTAPLHLSPRLVQEDACARPVTPCPQRTEWFIPGTEPAKTSSAVTNPAPIELIRPTPGLQLAYDPRIPPDHQLFRFELAHLPPQSSVNWIVDGITQARTTEPRYLWKLTRGPHELVVHIQSADRSSIALTPVSFTVK